MYNTINPINIVYRKPQTAQKKQGGAEIDVEQQGGDVPKNPDVLEKNDGHQFPHGAKVAIDYSKSKINISQVITDFKSTVLAINAPQEVSDEVNAYLSLVEKESLKEQPSREIIVSNLKNASKISDNYIAKTLNKPSKVVEGWVDALFLQNIVLRADPKQINEDFKVQIPKNEQKAIEVIETPKTEPNKAIEVKKVAQTPEMAEFMKVFKTGKKLSKENNPKEALVAFSAALDAATKTGNIDFKGATHLERGKVFDQYDYVNYALKEYNEATKCNDSNIKTHAHLKMAKIYDDYVKFEPALDHYHLAIGNSVNNPAGQSVALKGIGKMYTERFDKNNAETFNTLAIDVAHQANSPKLIGKTYREVASDLGYLGENKKALGFLKKSTEAFASLKKGESETNAQIAKNYLEASKLMKSLGNEARANSLLLKAHQYQNEV